MIKTFSDVETVDALQRAGFSELEKQFISLKLEGIQFSEIYKLLNLKTESKWSRVRNSITRKLGQAGIVHNSINPNTGKYTHNS